ncbi:hypothetical protein FOTG_10165 [Fusarium oxysporum f. sp. vasinfectum 25433]|uniref:Uncharacterized protein n=1 Tax=Fusarium oxysporum f. sp. vasinfectum 25433 TaxID=1089449 RepID=X0L8P9_FUSOX|nr:hypothetical protein FOTG_10165 [Fusarium oxysporum f. sp. vasinfectum 25433]
MFEAKDYLHFDLENPWQAFIIPTKGRSAAIPNQIINYLNPKSRKVVSTAEDPTRK